MEMDLVCRDGEVDLGIALISMMEAFVVETALVADKSVMWILLAVWILIPISIPLYLLVLLLFFVIWGLLYRCICDLGW